MDGRIELSNIDSLIKDITKSIEDTYNLEYCSAIKRPKMSNVAALSESISGEFGDYYREQNEIANCPVHPCTNCYWRNTTPEVICGDCEAGKSFNRLYGEQYRHVQNLKDDGDSIPYERQY